MFEGLDDIPWSALDHAYGEASEVPAMLRGMVAADPERRALAASAFWDGPMHQGSVYSSTVAAVPFLVEALAAPEADRRELLTILGAVGVGWVETRTGRPTSLGDFNPGPPRQGRTRCRLTDEWRLDRDCYLAVGAGCPEYVRLLANGAEPEAVRCQAAHLLSWFPSAAFDARGVLRAIVEDDAASETMRASAALALGHLGAPPPLIHRGLPLLDACVRLAAAIPRAPAARRALLAPLRRTSPPEPSRPWPWGPLDEALGRMGGPTEGLLTEYLASPDEGLRGWVMDRLLPRDRHPGMSGEHVERRVPGGEVASWSPMTRRFLGALVERPLKWPEVAATLRERLGLAFEPNRAEIVEALAREGARPGPRPRERTLSAAEAVAVAAQLRESDPALVMEALNSIRDMAPIPEALVAPLLVLASGEDEALARRAAWDLQWAPMAPEVAEELLTRMTEAPLAHAHLARLTGGLGDDYFQRTLDLVRTLLDAGHRNVGEALFPAVTYVDVSRALSTLDDPHPTIRVAACRALAWHVEAGGESAPVALRALFARRHDEDAEVREVVRLVLGGAGSAALSLLDEPALSPTEVAALVRAAGEDIASSGATERVTAHLSHPDSGVRMAAVDALARSEPRAECLDGLRRALGDAHQAVRERAAEVLRGFGPAAASVATDVATADLPAPLALRALAALRSFEAAEPLLRSLATSVADGDVWKELQLTLHALMPAARELALELVEAAPEVSVLQLWALEPCAPLDHPRVTAVAESDTPAAPFARYLRSPRC